MKEAGTFKASSLQDTDTFARWLSSRIPIPAAVLLEGPLGSGKTTFTAALARALGVTQEVNSPTFNLHNQYRFVREEQDCYLHHIDLYRTTSQDNFYELFSFLNEEQNFILILEWPSRLKNNFSLAGLPLILIRLESDGNNRQFHYQFE